MEVCAVGWRRILASKRCGIGCEVSWQCVVCLVIKLLDDGVDPNLCNSDGLTALHQVSLARNLLKSSRVTNTLSMLLRDWCVYSVH